MVGHRDPGGPDPTPTAAEQVAAQIERVRGRRLPRSRDLSIAAAVASTRDRADRTHRALGDLIELWESVVTAELAARTTLTAFRGAVLHVSVDSSPLAYELDRFLRNGGLARLREGYRGTLGRVRVRVRAAPDAAPGPE